MMPSSFTTKLSLRLQILKEKNVISTSEIETTETKFKRLRDLWVKETMHLSSMYAGTKHSAYKEIVSMGEEVLPLIIREMKHKKTGFWFYAICAITRAVPEIPKYARGKMGLVNLLYIAWYEDREEQRSLLRNIINTLEAENKTS